MKNEEINEETPEEYIVRVLSETETTKELTCCGKTYKIPTLNQSFTCPVCKKYVKFWGFGAQPEIEDVIIACMKWVEQMKKDSGI